MFNILSILFLFSVVTFYPPLSPLPTFYHQIYCKISLYTAINIHIDFIFDIFINTTIIIRIKSTFNLELNFFITIYFNLNKYTNLYYTTNLSINLIKNCFVKISTFAVNNYLINESLKYS